MSARCDVFKNPSVVEPGLLDVLPTRLVIPLVKRDELKATPITRLNPSFVVERSAVVLLTQQLGAVRASALTLPVASLAGRGAEILSAIDVLLSGV